MPYLHKKIEGKYAKVKDLKVRNYSHYTDGYRGAAHSICNLKYSVTKKAPIVFHNASQLLFSQWLQLYH